LEYEKANGCKKTPLIEIQMSKNIDSIKGVLNCVLDSQKSLFPDCPLLLATFSQIPDI
jgi:hypothetical protein